MDQAKKPGFGPAKKGGFGPDQTEPWLALFQVWKHQTCREITGNYDIYHHHQSLKNQNQTHQNKMSTGSTWGQEETRCLIDIWSDDFIITWFVCVSTKWALVWIFRCENRNDWIVRPVTRSDPGSVQDKDTLTCGQPWSVDDPLYLLRISRP